MKINITDDYRFELKEVYNEIILISDDADEFTICTRDGGFEFFYGGIKFEAKGGKINQLGNINPEK